MLKMSFMVVPRRFSRPKKLTRQTKDRFQPRLDVGNFTLNNFPIDNVGTTYSMATTNCRRQIYVES